MKLKTLTTKQSLLIGIGCGLTITAVYLALRILAPPLVRLYFWATYYQEATVGLLIVASIALIFKFLLDD